MSGESPSAAAMSPFGAALLDYLGGDSAAVLIVRRDDGLESSLPVAHFFRTPEDFTELELAALESCRGRVLDIGAGTGLHSLELTARGFEVEALDIEPRAVEVMTRRGVTRARCADVRELESDPFDTLLMLGHGIGMVEDMAGLDRFLAHARLLTRGGGRLILESVDVRAAADPRHLAYHEANRKAGRYCGETRVQVEYRGKAGPFCGWLHVDPHALQERAGRAGWACEVVLERPGGEYLARLDLVPTTGGGEPR